jgi:hypothetical protein
MYTPGSPGLNKTNTMPLHAVPTTKRFPTLWIKFTPVATAKNRCIGIVSVQLSTYNFFITTRQSNKGKSHRQYFSWQLLRKNTLPGTAFAMGNHSGQVDFLSRKK